MCLIGEPGYIASEAGGQPLLKRAAVPVAPAVAVADAEGGDEAGRCSRTPCLVECACGKSPLTRVSEFGCRGTCSVAALRTLPQFSWSWRLDGQELGVCATTASRHRLSSHGVSSHCERRVGCALLRRCRAPPGSFYKGADSWSRSMAGPKCVRPDCRPEDGSAQGSDLDDALLPALGNDADA